jgi:putative hydrolase of the HAD superfamily
MDTIKGIFFDLHGTLLLSNDINGAWDRWTRAFFIAIQNKGSNVTFSKFKELLQYLFRGSEPDIQEENFTLFMKRVKVLAEQLSIDIPKEDIRPLVDSIIRVWHEDMYFDEEAFPVITKLKEKYKVGLVTNWEHTPRIYELLRELDADELFDCVVVSDNVGYAKPDPRVFEPAFNITQVTANEAMYVGDMNIDIEGALNAGMVPVLIRRIKTNGNWDQFSKEHICSFSEDQFILIRRLSQLFDILKC